MTTSIFDRFPRLQWGRAYTWWGNALKRTFLPWFFHSQPPPRPSYCTIPPSLALRLSLWRLWRGLFFFPPLSSRVGVLPGQIRAAWLSSGKIAGYLTLMDWWGVPGQRRRSSAPLQWWCSRPPPAATEAPLPHLSLLRNATSTHAGQNASTLGIVEKVRTCGEICLPCIRVCWWQYLWWLKPISAPRSQHLRTQSHCRHLSRQVSVCGGRGSVCRLFNMAWLCRAVAKGQRVKRLVLKTFCSLGPKGSFVPRHQLGWFKIRD